MFCFKKRNFLRVKPPNFGFAERNTSSFFEEEAFCNLEMLSQNGISLLCLSELVSNRIYYTAKIVIINASRMASRWLTETVGTKI